jgi:hypothetical protein
MKVPRRQFLDLAAGAAALPAVSRMASAQTYPSRPFQKTAVIARNRSHRRAISRSAHSKT